MLYFVGFPNTTNARWLNEEEVISREVSLDTYIKHSNFGKKDYSRKLHDILEEQSIDLLEAIQHAIDSPDIPEFNLSTWSKNSIDIMDLTNNFYNWFESV